MRPGKTRLALLVLAVCGCGEEPGCLARSPDGAYCVSTIEITPAEPKSLPADTVRLSARVLVAGNPVPVQPRITWGSADTAVATVDSTGLVKAGSRYDTSASIFAIAGNASASVKFVVPRDPFYRISPAAYVLHPGMSVQLKGTSGFFDQPVDSWRSSVPAVAGVDAQGLVVASAVGEAIISAVFLTPDKLRYEDTITVVVIPWVGAHFTTAGGSGYGPINYDAKYDRECGLNADDSGLYCWEVLPAGTSPRGLCQWTGTQFRHFLFQCSAVPIRLVHSSKFSSLSVGDHGGCALTTTAEVYCFGWDYSGQLGTGSPAGDYRDFPLTRVNSGDHFHAVFAAGDGQHCALRMDDAAICWGGVFTSPTRVGSMTFRTLSERALNFNCGLAMDSTAYCWPTKSNKPPQQIDAGLRFMGIDANSNAACGLTAAGAAWCWAMTDTGVVKAPTQIGGTGVLLSIGPSEAASSPTGVPITCGLTQAGDLVCFDPLSSLFSPTSWVARTRDIGVSLKRFSGTVGIGLDGKAYTWRPNDLKAKLVPGQGAPP